MSYINCVTSDDLYGIEFHRLHISLKHTILRMYMIYIYFSIYVLHVYICNIHIW